MQHVETIIYGQLGTSPSNGIQPKVVYQLEVAPKEPKIVETALERMTTKTENERCANGGGAEDDWIRSRWKNEQR
jgi:hypothetical protein